MNDSTQAMVTDAPRRSGRERRQAESIYADARLAEKKKRAAMNDSKSSDRSVRYRKRKAEDEEEEDEMGLLNIFSDEEEEEEVVNSDRAKPTISRSREWNSLGTSRIQGSLTEQQNPADNIRSAFVSIDGETLYRNYSYYSHFDGEFRRHTSLNWDAPRALAAAQKSLVAEQDQHSISLERIFHRDSNISQVPYHADMMPCYNYFAESIQSYTSLESFKIVNFNLPQSPWLQNKIFTVLEQNRNLTALQLSNCFLSADDLTSLTKFVDGNETLSLLNISHTNIQSESTVKALAKALKKHPALRSVNLTYCNFDGGSKMMERLLAACKQCESLEIGHGGFDSENVAAVAKFLAKKHSLTSFSLVGAAVDNDNKKLLSDALMQNRTIEKLCLHSNQLQLPAVIRGTKKAMKALSRLTHLDLSFNKLSLSGAKSMAKFLAGEDSKLISLVMMKNNLTFKGADVLLSSLKKNTTLQHLDLSRNWITNKSVPAVIDLLKNNSTLVTLDLSGNKGLKTVEKRAFRGRYVYNYADGRYRYDQSQARPQVDGGRTKIVKDALFDTTSLETMISSNHTCAVFMTGFNHNDSYEETIRKINALDANEGRKIRLKIALARYANDDKKGVTDLLDPRSFDDLSLELMPFLLEMLQEAIGFNGLGNDVVTGWMKDRDKDKTSPYARTVYAKSLSLLFDTIKSWQSLPLLFARGPGDFCFDVPAQTEAKRKKKKKPQKRRRKFGDEEDGEDDAWLPKGARKTGKYERNPETGKWEFVPPPVY